MNKIFGKPRGQIAVLYAGIIAVLIGAIALCSDVGVMYVNWQQVQKAADAGAVAGALQFLPTAPAFTPASGCSGNVEQQAGCTYALNNSAALSEITVTVPAPKVPGSVPVAYASQTVQVTVDRTNIPVMFGRALGLKTPYQADATAIAVGPLPVQTVQNGLLPIGMPATPENLAFKTGVEFNVVNPDPGGNNPNVSWGPGNWGYLNIPVGTDGNGTQGGGGGQLLNNNLTDGCTCTVSVGNTLYPKTGETWGQVQSAINSHDPNGSLAPTTLTGNEPQLVTIPIVSSFSNGQTPVTILGFAEVWLMGISKSGAGQTLNVEFVKYISKYGKSGGGGTDYGAEAQPYLVQ
jgi:Putative Flp pilus-assembly TadE/G-like